MVAPGSRGQPCPHPGSPITTTLPAAGFQQIYLEPLLKFHISLKKLQLHEAEYVLLQAMLLFSPGRDHGDRQQGIPSALLMAACPPCTPRPRQHHPAGLHRPVPGEGGPDAQELH